MISGHPSLAREKGNIRPSFAANEVVPIALIAEDRGRAHVIARQVDEDREFPVRRQTFNELINPIS